MKAVKKKKDFTRGSVRVFFSYYTPHRKLLLLDLVMAVFAVAAELVFPYATRYALNRLLPNGLYKAFFLLMAGLLGAYLLRALAQYIVTVYGHELGVRVEADMREDIFAKVQTLSFAFFDKHRTGKLMSRMTTDLFDITELAHHGPETVIQASLTIAGAIVILATIRWELALILFLLLPVLLAVVMRLRLRLRARSLDVKRETAEINTAVEAGVSGIRTVKAFANEQDAMDKFRTSNEKFKKVKKSYYRIFGVFNASTEFAMALMQLVTLAAGGVFIMQGKMDAVDLITFSLYVSVFMAPIRKLTQFVEQFQKGSSGFLRFLEIMRAEPDVKDAPDAKELENVKGGVEYRDVSFHYQNGEEVLRHVDLTIAPGETLALVGPSGSGKTTLSQLLPRFYDVTGGAVLVDGQDVRTVTQSSLHRYSGIIQQYLLHLDNQICTLSSICGSHILFEVTIKLIVLVEAVVCTTTVGVELRTMVTTVPVLQESTRLTCTYGCPVGVTQIVLTGLHQVPLCIGVCIVDRTTDTDLRQGNLNSLGKICQTTVNIGDIVQVDILAIQLTDAIAVCIHDTGIIQKLLGTFYIITIFVV